MLALELVADKAGRTPLDSAEGVAARIAETARKRGVFVRAMANKIVISPPLTLTLDEADVIARTLREALQTE